MQGGVATFGDTKGMFVYDLTERNFPLTYHVALFGINRTHDRPAETFVYVVFHSMRIMYVCL